MNSLLSMSVAMRKLRRQGDMLDRPLHSEILKFFGCEIPRVVTNDSIWCSDITENGF